jgi:ABC-type Fe3+ transport system substrate-binding protein
VLAERRAGKYLADVFSGGTTSPSQVLVPANALDPIRTAFLLPEVANEALWFKKQFHFADSENQFVFLNDATINIDHLVYNTTLVRNDEIRSLWDMIQPKWKGKIVAYDPRLAGGASNNMRFVYYNPKLGPAFLHRLFSEMDVTIGSNNRQLMDWLAAGKFSLGLFIGRDIETALKQGLPVAEVNSVKNDGAMLSSIPMPRGFSSTGFSPVRDRWPGKNIPTETPSEVTFPKTASPTGVTKCRLKMAITYSRICLNIMT